MNTPIIKIELGKDSCYLPVFADATVELIEDRLRYPAAHSDEDDIKLLVRCLTILQRVAVLDHEALDQLYMAVQRNNTADTGSNTEVV